MCLRELGLVLVGLPGCEVMRVALQMGLPLPLALLISRADGLLVGLVLPMG